MKTVDLRGKTGRSSCALIAHIRDARREALVFDPRRRSAVIANLTFLHGAVVASEQLLLDAAEATDRLSSNGFPGQLAAYYRAHLEEERGHAAWLQIWKPPE